MSATPSAALPASGGRWLRMTDVRLRRDPAAASTIRESERAIAAIAAADHAVVAGGSVATALMAGAEERSVRRLQGIPAGWRTVFRPESSSRRGVLPALLDRSAAVERLRMSDLVHAGWVPMRDRRDAPWAERILATVHRDDLSATEHAAAVYATCCSSEVPPLHRHRLASALVQVTLRRAGIAHALVLPLSVAVLQAPGDFERAALEARRGDAVALQRLIARSWTVTAQQAAASIARIVEIRSVWQVEASVRRGTAVNVLLDELITRPTLSGPDAVSLCSTPTSAYAALARLERVGILHEATGRRRGREWVAADVIDELERLERSISARLSAP